jgi:hypothetical protein
MKNLIAVLTVFGLAGCTSCHQQPAVSGGIPMAGMSATTSSGHSACEAIPALGLNWETVSFRIPKPRLYAVPRPQAGPQVVGIPILTGGPTMTMATAAPMMAAPMAVQPQYVEPQSNVQPQSAAPQSAPASAPPCSSGCAEGCNSQASIASECDALMRDISCLQQQLSVETAKATVKVQQ